MTTLDGGDHRRATSPRRLSGAVRAATRRSVAARLGLSDCRAAIVHEGKVVLAKTDRQGRPICKPRSVASDISSIDTSIRRYVDTSIRGWTESTADRRALLTHPLKCSKSSRVDRSEYCHEPAQISTIGWWRHLTRSAHTDRSTHLRISHRRSPDPLQHLPVRRPHQPYRGEAARSRVDVHPALRSAG
ncbi:MAG: hypothetical protein ACI9MC_001772 [Kiritimatiellia bacterium]